MWWIFSYAHSWVTTPRSYLIAPWCRSLGVPTSFQDLLIWLLPPQTHFACALTSYMRNPVACSLLCVVSCVHVHFSNIPCLPLLSLPSCPPAGKPFFQFTALATRGQQNPVEPGLIQQGSPSLGPRVSPSIPVAPRFWAASQAAAADWSCCLPLWYLVL